MKPPTTNIQLGTYIKRNIKADNSDMKILYIYLL